MFNCSQQEITLLWNSGTSKPIELIKNQNLIQLFDRDTTVAEFIVKDLEHCQINKYTIYDRMNKIEGTNELSERFDATNYLEEGNIYVNTNVDSVGPKEILISFQIRAETYGFYKDLEIDLTIGCFNETHLDTVLLDPQPTYDFLRQLPQDDSGPVFKLYFDFAQKITEFHLNESLAWESDVQGCGAA